jgi:hypothetical protein
MINKNGDVFKALIANDKETGTIERIFNDIEEAREEWCGNSDIYEQNGEMLEKTLSLFSFLERHFDESDVSLKHRNELLFYRCGDTLWGDVWNVRRIFQRYFNTEYVYVVNSTNPADENILLDGDFEIQNNVWSLDGCSYDTDARLNGKSGVKFQGQGICRQAVAVNKEAAYFLHFFLEGKITVQIKDNNNRYWDPQNGEFGGWTADEKSISFSAEKWDAKSVYFLTDNEITGVSVIFIGLENENAYLDYVRLFLKGAYPSFTLIVVIPGNEYTDAALSLAPGKGDPVLPRKYDGFGHYSSQTGETENDFYLNEEKPLAPWEDDEDDTTTIKNYNDMSYIEQSHIFGTEGSIEAAKDIHKELLEMVGAGGIVSYIEILTRELD